MIPKIVHYCWFGRTPLPESARKCIASWKKYLPDYEIKEWNEDNFDVNSIPYTREAYRLKKYAFVSDYARMWILYKYGGLYFDTDVEIIKPLDDIIARGNFMGCEAHEVSQVHANELGLNPGLGLGVAPGLGLYKEVLDWYQTHHFATWDGKFTKTIVDIVSEAFATKKMEKKENGILFSDEIYIYPPEFFCPKNYFTGELTITPNTRSIHHYAATWTNQHRSILDKIKKRVSFMRAHFNI